SESSARYSLALLANRSMLCPSTPAAPLLARTFSHASASVLGADILSIRLNHRPPLTPLTSAEIMRSVQIEASTQPRPWPWAKASAPCVAACGTTGASLPSSVFAHPPPCPAFPRNGFAAHSSRRLRRIGTTRALNPGGIARSPQVSPLTPLCLRNIQPSTT